MLSSAITYTAIYLQIMASVLIILLIKTNVDKVFSLFHLNDFYC